MPEMNKVDIVINNEKYSVFTDEDKDYIKKIENLINNQVEYFKNSEKHFNGYNSVIFTSFVIADKYLKAIKQLDKFEYRVKSKPKLSKTEMEKNALELKKVKNEYDKVCDEKEKYLEELLVKNSEKELLEDKLREYEKKLSLNKEEIFQLEIQIEELKRANKELEELLELETT